MNFFSEFGLPAVLVFMMFAMGLSLTPADFTRIAQRPGALAIGISCQLIILPLMAFLVTQLFGIAGELAVGFMILAACPGGPLSNLLTHLARGDTALSISLTAILSILSVVTLPVIVNWALGWFLGADARPLAVGSTVLGLTAVTLVPVGLGMVLRHFRTAFALRWEPRARRAAVFLFLVILIAAVLVAWDDVVTHLPALAPPAFAMCLLVLATANVLARLLRREPVQVIALTIECGIQNGSLAMFVAATLIGNEVMMLPGAGYGLLMYPPILVFVALMTRGQRDTMGHVTQKGV